MISVELAALDIFGRTFVATNNQLMLKPIILSGEGIAFFTPVGLMKELEEGEIVARPIAGSQLHTTEIGIMIPRHRQISEATAAVTEALSQSLAKFNDQIHAVIGRLTKDQH
jgi:DNA-binding transcriptional LysR family regulator